jgi:hypothetical protein
VARVLVSGVLAETILPQDSVLIRYIRVIRGLSALTRFPNFPRKPWPIFAQYISERPELTAPAEESKKAKTTEGH